MHFAQKSSRRFFSFVDMKVLTLENDHSSVIFARNHSGEKTISLTINVLIPEKNRTRAWHVIRRSQNGTGCTLTNVFIKVNFRVSAKCAQSVSEVLVIFAHISVSIMAPEDRQKRENILFVEKASFLFVFQNDTVHVYFKRSSGLRDAQKQTCHGICSRCW